MLASFRSRSRAGFTLVELLVVIAIIGTLVGLLLPAVQVAREAARQSACQNTLKNLSLGALNFESARGYLPHGAIEWSEGYKRPGASQANAGWSWLYFVLPYMESMDLYQKGAVQSGELLEADGGSPNRGANLQNYGTAWMRCPSDSFDYGLLGYGVTMPLPKSCSNYTSCMGPKTTRNSEQAPCSTSMPISLYTGFISTWASGQGEVQSATTDPNTIRGLFSYVGTHSVYTPDVVTANEPRMRRLLKHVLDGTSKTILFGECYAVDRIKNDNKNAFIAWGNVPTTTMVPINLKDGDYPTGCSPGNWGTGLAFKSKHINGANFSFGDGTVRFVNENLNMSVFQLLGHHADKQNVTMPD